MTMTDPNQDERLKRLLTEDFGPEGEAYLPTLRQLVSVPAHPEPEVQRAALKQLLAHQRAARQRWHSHYIVAFIRAELRVLHWELWAASAFVMVLGVLVTVSGLQAADSPAAFPIVYIAPVIAAFGVAFVFGPLSDPPLEVILALSHSIRTLLLARLTLIFGFNLALALAGSLILAVLSPAVSLLPLIGAWLAPMTLLSALAFCVGVASREPLIGGLVSLSLWVWLNVRLPFLPVPTFLNDSVWRYALAAALGLIGLWWAGKPEHWLGSRS